MKKLKILLCFTKKKMTNGLLVYLVKFVFTDNVRAWMILGKAL